MINFINDYNAGAAPEILDALVKINSQEFVPYGEDSLCDEARELIKFELERNDVDIHFMEGGTQANMTVISSALRSHEGVIATVSGHIATHETGAIESTGHKVITVPHHNGKMKIADIEEALAFHDDEHKVKPRMIYISQSTEWGSIYTKAELAEIYEFAQGHNLFLYVDGARLGAALTSKSADFTMADMAKYADAFTIGGTKNGIFIGEAVVITNPLLKTEFRYAIKQKGALMAKGWLLGVQFKELFRDGLFYRLAEHANNQSEKIKETLADIGVEMKSDSPTNQLFPIFPMSFIMELSQNFGFQIIEKVGDDQAVIRFVTSWATGDVAVSALIATLAKYRR
ncbi:MAG: aminotransferase class I/II-fold pyridoxal phosphate-dependent enzyme [Clostridiales bacterium]